MSFLKYTGKFDYIEETKNYWIQIEDMTEYFDKIFMNFPKPITDNNFKEIFWKNPEIAISLINSFLYSKTNKIKNIEFLSWELPGRIGKYSDLVNTNDYDLLRVDILYRCTLDEEKNSEVGSKIIDNRNNDNTYIIDLQIQIGICNENTRWFLAYAK